MNPDSWLAIAVLAVKRRMAIVALLLSVSIVTVVALVGMHPYIGMVSTREALLLAAINLMAMAAYFRWLSPERDDVSPIVTSGLALLAAAFALISSKVILTPVGWVYELELIGVSVILLLTIVVWGWYDLLVLHSFSEHVDELSDVLPRLDSIDDPDDRD